MIAMTDPPAPGPEHPVGMPTVDIRNSFEGFVRSVYPGLVGVAGALTGSIDDAEDMVQDTLLKTFVRWDRVCSYEHPQGWAHRVLVNRCTGWWRRKRTEAAYLARLRREEAIVAGPSPAAIAFWEAVRRLPARHQQVVALYYAADLPVDEVAAILTVPPGTVRSDLTRARAALAELLEG
jgi:RNA polymerase sigma-70 factor (ECF subfamily)